MKQPNTPKSSGTSRDTSIAADGDFVDIDLNSYEKDVGICLAEQEPVSKPVGGLKKRVMILILVLLFLGTGCLIAALVLRLMRNQKL
jgi:hypothetical protein